MSIPMPPGAPDGAPTPAAALSLSAPADADAGADTPGPLAEPCTSRTTRSWTDWLAFQLSGRRAKVRTRRKSP